MQYSNLSAILTTGLLVGIVNADHNVFHTEESIMVVPLVEVIDGDTIRSSLTLPSPLNKISIRILGMNSPESTWRAKCEEEKSFGIEAKEYLKKFLDGKSVMILKNFKYGTYAGRILAEVYVDDLNIGDHMINKGYAVKSGAKIDKDYWCNTLKSR